jgi:ribonuclease PH
MNKGKKRATTIKAKFGMGHTNHDRNKRQLECQSNWLSREKLRSSRIEEWLQSCVIICKIGNILAQENRR